MWEWVNGIKGQMRNAPRLVLGLDPACLAPIGRSPPRDHFGTRFNAVLPQDRVTASLRGAGKMGQTSIEIISVLWTITSRLIEQLYFNPDTGNAVILHKQLITETTNLRVFAHKPMSSVSLSRHNLQLPYPCMKAVAPNVMNAIGHLPSRVGAFQAGRQRITANRQGGNEGAIVHRERP